MSSQQQMNEIMKDMIKEYIKSRAKDYCYQHFPEDYAQALSGKTDYKVVRKLYDIFTRGDELFEYTRYDKMREQIENGIDSLVDDFKEKHYIIAKVLRPYRKALLPTEYDIKVLSLYYSDFDDDKLYKMCKILDLDKIEEKNNELYRLKLRYHLY